MASAVIACWKCGDLVPSERLAAHLAGHALVAPPPLRGNAVLGSVLAWVFIGLSLVAFAAVVWRLIRWAAA